MHKKMYMMHNTLCIPMVCWFYIILDKEIGKSVTGPNKHLV
jgi:hypothetical protein